VSGCFFVCREEEGEDGSQALTILQTMGNGCAFLDFDNDGRLDVLVVDRPLRLFRGDGKGRFRDVIRAMQLDKARRPFHGVRGRRLRQRRLRRHIPQRVQDGPLFRNERGKFFRDVTARVGLRPQPWGTSCGFADLEGDGWLDLFFANYVEFGPDRRRYLQRCDPLACGPDHYNPERPTLYRNVGGSRFADVTRESGARASEGKGLAVGFADYDDDGDTDIMVANDQVAGDLFLNTRGDGHFANVALAADIAFALEAKPQAGKHGR
jgi:hypothetical protein